MTKIIDKLVTVFGFEVNDKQLEKANEKLEKFKKILEGVGIAFAGLEIVKMANEWQNTANKLRTTGIAGDKLKTSLDQLLAVSMKSGTGIEANAELYQQLTNAMGEVTTQAQRMQVVDTLSKIFAMNGTSATQAESSMGDLSRALDGQTVVWMELKRAMQDVPALKTIVNNSFKSMGTTVKKAVQGGKFATKDFIQILLKSHVEVNKQFNATKRTFGQSFMALKDSLISFFGLFAQNTGFTSAFTTALDTLAKAIASIAIFFQYHATLLKTAMTVLALVFIKKLNLMSKVGTLIKGLSLRFYGLIKSIFETEQILKMLRDSENMNFFQRFTSKVKMLGRAFNSIGLFALIYEVQQFIAWMGGANNTLGATLNKIGLTTSSFKNFGNTIKSFFAPISSFFSMIGLGSTSTVLGFTAMGIAGVYALTKMFMFGKSAVKSLTSVILKIKDVVFWLSVQAAKGISKAGTMFLEFGKSAVKGVKMAIKVIKGLTIWETIIDALNPATLFYLAIVAIIAIFAYLMTKFHKWQFLLNGIKAIFWDIADPIIFISKLLKNVFLGALNEVKKSIDDVFNIFHKVTHAFSSVWHYLFGSNNKKEIHVFGHNKMAVSHALSSANNRLTARPIPLYSNSSNSKSLKQQQTNNITINVHSNTTNASPHDIAKITAQHVNNTLKQQTRNLVQNHDSYIES